MKEEFLRKLKALMEEYRVSIGFSVSDCSDTHGLAEYVINTLEDCGNTIAAQAAVIEKFKRAIGDWDRAETPSELQSAESGLLKALAISTDSTQILDEVRLAEREKVIDKCVALGAIERDGVFSAVIRAME